MGNCYFINEVDYSSIDFSSIKACFWSVLGLILFLNSSEMTVSLLIYRFDGISTFLTNGYILTLLWVNKVLLKKYKRTDVDTKKMYRKFFELSWNTLRNVLSIFFSCLEWDLINYSKYRICCLVCFVKTLCVCVNWIRVYIFVTPNFLSKLLVFYVECLNLELYLLFLIQKKTYATL